MKPKNKNKQMGLEQQFKFHYVQMKLYKQRTLSYMLEMFKFHYVQMKQWILEEAIEYNLKFKFHYVQMKQGGAP